MFIISQGRGGIYFYVRGEDSVVYSKKKFYCQLYNLKPLGSVWETG